MNSKDSDKDNSKSEQMDQSRRDFLKKSKYAAYATPLVTGLIIKSNAAHASGDDAMAGFT